MELTTARPDRAKSTRVYGYTGKDRAIVTKRAGRSICRAPRRITRALPASFAKTSSPMAWQRAEGARHE